MSLKYMLIPAIFFTLSAGAATLFFNMNSGERKINLWIFIAYTLVTILAFGLTAFTIEAEFDGLIYNYIFTAVIFLLFGAVHLQVFSMLNPPGQDEPFWHELVYAIYVCLIGLFAYVLVFKFLKKDDPEAFSLLFATAGLFFIIPFLVWKTADFAAAIPAVEYPRWYFPVGQELEMPELDDDKIIVIALEYYGKGNDKTPVRPRIKAPLLMDFGYYIALSMDQINTENANDEQIEYMDSLNMNPVGWIFYIKPKKWWQSEIMIDPSLTVLENGLKEDDVIVLERA